MTNKYSSSGKINRSTLGLDANLRLAEQTDLKSIQRIQNAISKVRRNKSTSSRLLRSLRLNSSNNSAV